VNCRFVVYSLDGWRLLRLGSHQGIKLIRIKRAFVHSSETQLTHLLQTRYIQHNIQLTILPFHSGLVIQACWLSMACTGQAGQHGTNMWSHTGFPRWNPTKPSSVPPPPCYTIVPSHPKWIFWIPMWCPLSLSIPASRPIPIPHTMQVGPSHPVKVGWQIPDHGIPNS